MELHVLFITNIRLSTVHTLLYVSQSVCEDKWHFFFFANWKLDHEYLPSSRPSEAWWRDYCRKTSPHRWSPGSAVPCHSCPPWRRTRPQTGGRCRWSSAGPRSSAASGRSSAPRWWCFLSCQRSSTGDREKGRYRIVGEEVNRMRMGRDRDVQQESERMEGRVIVIERKLETSNIEKKTDVNIYR